MGDLTWLLLYGRIIKTTCNFFLCEIFSLPLTLRSFSLEMFVVYSPLHLPFRKFKCMQLIHKSLQSKSFCTAPWLVTCCRMFVCMCVYLMGVCTLETSIRSLCSSGYINVGAVRMDGRAVMTILMSGAHCVPWQFCPLRSPELSQYFPPHVLPAPLLSHFFLISVSVLASFPGFPHVISTR